MTKRIVSYFGLNNMRTSFLIITICFSFIFATTLFARDLRKCGLDEPVGDFKRWGVGTNAISDLAFLTPDIQLNAYLNKHSVVSAGGSYGWWGFSRNRKRALRQWLIKAEYNYYLKGNYSFTGHHFGVAVQTGQSDKKKKESARRGHFTTAGLLYGYTWKLKKNWYRDSGFGLGYQYTFFHNYEHDPEAGYYCISHSAKNRFGLTNLNLSVIYRFNLKKK